MATYALTQIAEIMNDELGLNCGESKYRKDWWAFNRIFNANVDKLVGDNTYSNGKNEFGVVGQCLHAKQLEFKHPITGKEIPLEEWYEEGVGWSEDPVTGDELYILGSIKELLPEEYSWLWGTTYWTRTVEPSFSKIYFSSNKVGENTKEIKSKKIIDKLYGNTLKASMSHSSLMERLTRQKPIQKVLLKLLLNVQCLKNLKWARKLKFKLLT